MNVRPAQGPEVSSRSVPPALGPSPAASSFYPLDDFYARTGLPLPPLTVVARADLPEPYRTLLAHDNDMTPTLEAFHRCELHIEVWSRVEHDGFYFREVVLRLDTTQRPVEFGANKINLALFDPAVRRLILDEYLPLGHILKMRKVPHAGHPTAFLQVQADPQMKRAFGLRGDHVLYGRQNTIRDPQGRPLSQIVEILPPL
jgi:chorismate-pyruvate lyase